MIDARAFGLRTLISLLLEPPSRTRTIVISIAYFGFSENLKTLLIGRSAIWIRRPMRKTLQSARHIRLVELLVEARLAAGLSQGDLAKRLGRPQSILSSLESGGRRVDVIELLEIADSVELDLHALMKELRATPL